MNTNLILLIIAIAYYIVNVLYDLFIANNIKLNKSNSNEIDLSHFDTKPVSGINDIKAKIVKSSGIETVENPIDNSLNNSQSNYNLPVDKLDKSNQMESIRNILNVENVNKDMETTELNIEQTDMATGVAYETIEANDNSLTINDLEEQQDFVISEANLLTYTNLKSKIGLL